jgi:hypothetical protein
MRIEGRRQLPRSFPLSSLIRASGVLYSTYRRALHTPDIFRTHEIEQTRKLVSRVRECAHAANIEDLISSTVITGLSVEKGAIPYAKNRVCFATRRFPELRIIYLSFEQRYKVKS